MNRRLRARGHHDHRSSAPVIVAALVLGSTACKVGPDYERPRTTVSAEWSTELAAEASDASVPDATSAPLEHWWTTFEDPTLERLVVRALAANPDLRRAAARVLEARAARGIVEADLYPSIDVTASAERSKTSETIEPVFPGAGRTQSLYRAGFDASWELDLFGGVRREIDAADADVAAAIEDRRDVLVSLLAEVASNYAELRGSQRRVAIARANLAAQESTLELTRIRSSAGLVSDLDVVRAQAQARTTASEIPSLESDARQAIHRLSVLLAEEPGALVQVLTPTTDEIAPLKLPATVPIGLPSELLRRRADVRRAERELAAATARVGVETADYFPRFSLTGFAGVESSSTSTLTDSGSFLWSLGPSMRWPLLDFGRIRSRVAAADAREEQALAAYEATVLTSLREVEDALVAFTQEQLRREALAAAVDANRRAVSLADQLYQQGSEDFLSVLQAERDLFASEDALVDSERRVSTNLVALYKSLGGGWEIEVLATSPPARGKPGARTLDLSARRGADAP